MPEYKAPGIYVEEVSGGAKPIEAVSTSTACFIGFTEKAEMTRFVDREEFRESVARKPHLVTSWNEYMQTFGSFVPGVYTPLSVYGFFENGGTKCYIVSLAQVPQKLNQLGISLVEIEESGEPESPSVDLDSDNEDSDKEPVVDNEIYKLYSDYVRDYATEKTNLKSKLGAKSTATKDASDAQKKTIVAIEKLLLEQVALEKTITIAADRLAAAQTSDDSEAIKKTQDALQGAIGKRDKIAEDLAAQRKQLQIDGQVVADAKKAEQAIRKQLEVATEKLEKATEDQKKLAQAFLNTEDQGAGDKIYLTVKTKQHSANELMRVRLKKARENGSRRSSQQEDDKSQNGDNGTSSKETSIGQFELIVERKLQSAPQRDDQEDQWKTLEERGVTILKNKENQQLRVKYRGGKRPDFVDLAFDPVLKMGVTAVADLQTELKTLTDDEKEFRIALPVNSQEIEPVGSKVLMGGDENEVPLFDKLADYEDISIICMPDLMIPLKNKNIKLFDSGKRADEVNLFVQSIQQSMISHCESMTERVFIVDPPPDKTPQEIRDWRMKEAGYDSSYAALYYPWIKVLDPATNEVIDMPPSGHVAGVWARTDQQRGVHKAPANEVLRGTVALPFDVSQRHQEILNPDGINCIRFFPGRGYRIWGARTLSSDPEWRYLNVRRLFNMMKQSIQIGTQWAVFEPNDQRLWAKLRRDVRNFLMGIYSQGMLFGATAGEAFFVKCDIDNNPIYTRDLGQLFVDVGVAPVKPAEFIIFRIRQWSPEYEE